MKKSSKVGLILGIVCLVLTFGICVQLKTIEGQSQTIGQSQTEAKLKDEIFKWKEKYDSIQKDLDETEIILERYRTKASTSSDTSANTEAELKLANNLLGLTDLTGRGITLTLEDNKSVTIDTTLNISNYLVHDGDIIQLINELRNAGAEAISINGQRIINTTGIFCDGNVIKINDTKVGAPYVIKAIGYPEYLESALTRPGGYIQILNRDGVVTKLEKSNNIAIPKFTGSYTTEFMEVVKEKE